MPAIKKSFNIVELSTENESQKNKTGSYDEFWLEKLIAKLVKQFDDAKTANLFM